MDSSTRTATAPVEPLFLERWSPRSFADRPVEPADLDSLFEAARWAPSCMNLQPWLFVHATAEAPRARVAGLLVEGNRVWAERAPVLGVVFARRHLDAEREKPNRWAAFDAGAAAYALSLQATRLGLSTHLMGGFDAEASYAALGVDPEEYEALAAFAVGHRGERSALPEHLAAREQPSDRRPRAEIARELL